MPAHITHELFSRDAFERAFDKPTRERFASNTNYRVFGAQGPDFFLHNRRTQPSGLTLGKLLHTEGYGNFVACLITEARRRGNRADSPLALFILGFLTHASLDRATHPFIDYFSGWVERSEPSSIRFTSMHAFFERIIDVFVLRMRGDETISGYDFYSHVDLGESMPDPIVEAIVPAIEATYPEFSGNQRIGQRVQNAYSDTMRFYRFTNPAGGEHVEAAWERDEGGSDPTKRVLALFHPDGLPELDYLNLAHSTWNHPGEPAELHTESFFDLYDAALEEVVRPLRLAYLALMGEESPEAVASATGNGNLSDRNEERTRRKLSFVGPLPLDEVLAVLYAKIAERIKNR